MKKQPISRSTTLLVAFVVVSIAALATKQHCLNKQEVVEEEESYHLYDKNVVDGGGATGTIISSGDQDDWKSLVGFWEGALDEELRLMYRVTPTYGQVFGYSLDQGGGMIPASATRFNAKTGEIRFFFATIGGVYRATLDPTGQRMIGTWKQSDSVTLDMHRWVPPSENTVVPREFRFLQDKIVSGDPKQLLEMAGFWSGYLDDTFDQDEKEPPVLVIVEVEQVSTDILVEPKIFLSDDSPLPFPIRSFMVNADGATKIVVDNQNADAIFHGQLDGHILTGTVQYDDADDTPTLTLVWSEDHPMLEQYKKN